MTKPTLISEMSQWPSRYRKPATLPVVVDLNNNVYYDFTVKRPMELSEDWIATPVDNIDTDSAKGVESLLGVLADYSATPMETMSKYLSHTAGYHAILGKLKLDGGITQHLIDNIRQAYKNKNHMFSVIPFDTTDPHIGYMEIMVSGVYLKWIGYTCLLVSQNHVPMAVVTLLSKASKGKVRVRIEALRHNVEYKRINAYPLFKREMMVS